MAARRWDDDLHDALIGSLGEARGSAIFRQFAAAMPAGYRSDVAAPSAVQDVEMMALLAPEKPLAMALYRPLEAEPGTLRFKLFHLGGPITLSDSLPMPRADGPSRDRRAALQRVARRAAADLAP
jgi:glutamate dehydrogenase